MTLEQVLERIPPLDAEAMAQAKQHWDALAKPLHGLGDLEDILIRIAGICRTPRINLRNKAGFSCVSMNIPSAPTAIPALATVSINCGIPPVTPLVWLGCCKE